ncbi:hypothetical protein BVRB_5g119980 [Beta vulgaris subsp. vulgaris]|nr:hypothetical protein BVRB_5g119980 [Beta vulgaris subsp. vulgaris]
MQFWFVVFITSYCTYKYNAISYVGHAWLMRGTWPRGVLRSSKGNPCFKSTLIKILNHKVVIVDRGLIQEGHTLAITVV